MSFSVDDLGQRSDVNLVATWSVTSAAIGGALGGPPSCPFAVSGLPAAPFNGAAVLERIDDPGALLDELVAFMAGHQVPFLLWVRDGVDDELVELARGAGFTEAGRPPAMALSSIGAVPSPPAGVTIEEVVDDTGIDHYRRVLHLGFGFPMEIVERLVTISTASGDQMAAVLLRVDDEAVACAQLSVTGTTAGIWNVATLPDHRRRGLGAAATWAAIGMGAARGCDHAILTASEMGQPVYRDMGFEGIGHYLQLAGPTADA